MDNEMFKYDERMGELIFDYCRKRLSFDPVTLDFSGEKGALDAVLAGLMCPEGNDPERVLQVFVDHLAPAVISCDSPRFLAFIPAAPTRASMLFDMIVSCSSLQGSSWLEAAGAVAAENQALRVLADLAGLPSEAGGVFVSGGSAANLSALAVARDTAHKSSRRRRRRLRVAVSDQTHSSIRNALRILDMEEFVVPTTDHRLTGDTLRRALAGDRHRSEVVAVAATAGTTNAGIVDDLAGIADVAARHDLWFHVDGAYGGAALLAPSARHLFTGIERADSFVVDPHKWLFAPFDCAALLYRDPTLAKAVHSQHASYLDVFHAEPGWNPSDYAYHLTRRARGMALWFSLAVHGIDAYRTAVEAALTMAHRAAARIDAADHLELVREPGLSIVLFRRRGWQAADYHRWSRELLASQVGFVTPTTWQGETTARFAFLHPNTTVEMVDEILATMM
ncbi:MAG TPA: aminotransferase class I/II-fold pyridoxal phosphate-dependent enzyme [Acidimicrobiales bacterium]|nr:aminotransferase class I/II-fold pyridoxal phosphate-dependent enzyme [Acidimicrobiales bacterium]